MAILKKKTKSATETTAVTAPKKSGSGSAYRVLVRPLLSEKSARGEKHSQYTFAVAIDATKTEIVRAVEQVYGVKPTSVRTLVTEGKTARFGRSVGRRKDWKKAIVTLPEGKTISIHTGV